VPKISRKIKDKKYFMSLHFSTLKNSQIHINGYLFQSSVSGWILYMAYMTAIFEFDRPEICEGGVLE